MGNILMDVQLALQSVNWFATVPRKDKNEQEPY